MTNKEVIEIFSKKSPHYELSDDFVKKHQQLNGGYITYAKESNKVIDKSIAEPDQKWHLLVSYYGIKEKQSKLKLEEEVNCWTIKGLKCPELLLWMAEAAGCDIKEAKREAEKLCDEGNRKQAHIKIKELITWQMIENKIKNN